MDVRPILLFGMPRSGTTWLGKVFDSHPETLYRHEPDSGGSLDAAVPLMPDPVAAETCGEAIRAYVRALPANRSVRVTGKLPLFPKAYQIPLGASARQALLLAAKAAERWVKVPDLPEFVRSTYPGPVYLVWKSIESLGRLGVMARALPDARAIHIIRHPCGYVSSVLGGEAAGFMPGTVSSSEDYGIFRLLLETDAARRHGLTEDHLRSLHPVERLAWRWLLYNEKAMDDLEGLENSRIVLYEDLCRDPVGGYRGLFEFAGLSWADQSHAFVDASTHSERSAYFSVFKDPERAASGWKRKLPDEDQARILGVVAGTRPGALYGV